MEEYNRILPFNKNGFWLVFSIIFIEGFASIGIEILTIRQLLPVAGSSLNVTSLIIGIFLLFLALGYQRGGKVEENLELVLRRNFFLAAIWMGIGLSYSFILAFFDLVHKLTGHHILYPLIAYLLLIIAPLVYVLGQTLPISMNMFSQNNRVSVIGGNSLGISTLGSFLGATFTTLVLMTFLGVAWTVFIISSLLLFLTILLNKKNIGLIELFAVSCIVFLIYWLNIIYEKNNFALTNTYANYEIIKESNKKILLINNTLMSSLDNHRKSFPYVEYIKVILFHDLNMRNSSILVLGAGGFTLSAEGTFSNKITYVDIDSAIKKLVVPQFIEKIEGEMIVADAREYIHNVKQQFNAIVVDVYNSLNIPSHLVTQEYIRDIQKKLAPRGTAIFNIIANPSLSDPYSKRIDNTIRSVFNNCMATPLNFSHELTNILYVCTNTLNQKDHTIYSDNLNSASTDHFEW